MHRTGWLLRLELPSDPEIMPVVRSAISRLTEEMGFSAPDCRALTRAVDEALANIIRHAYGGRPDQSIGLLCRRVHVWEHGARRVGLEIVLIDHGAAADRKKLCGRAFEDVRPGGLGLHFIQDAVDVMQYSCRFRKNRLRLVKYLPEPESQSQIVGGK